MPLYNDGEVKEETKKIIESHLKDCTKCRHLYNETAGNVFAEVKIDEPEMPKEKTFLIKARRAAIILATLLVIVITTSTVLSYEAGRIKGVYGERFEMAEENNLFIDVNQEKSVEGKGIVLEKVLLDNSITSLIIKTSYDINDFDSVTLKDDRGNFYGKVFTFFNSIPRKYQKNNGYTILNFEPVDENAKALKLEMIKWKPHPAKEIVFDIEISETEKLSSVAEYKDVLKTEIDGVELTVDRIISGLSQSEIHYMLNYGESRFDGVSLGWYHKDTIENRGKILVVDSATGDTLPVLAINDITFEKELEKNGSDPDKIRKPDYVYHKVILNPIPQDSTELKIHYTDLYGYYSLNNRELKLDFGDREQINLNKEYSVGELILKIKTASFREREIQLDYEVMDKQGNRLKGYILDARIRKLSERYAVPEEGRHAGSSIFFKTGSEKQYVVNLSRLGLKLESEPLKICLEN